MALNVIITNAGRAELINAENTGTAPVQITQIGFTAATFTPTAALTALPSEAKRVSSIAGEVVAPDTISVTAKDEGTTAYTVRGFGVYTASGTLFAVYGQAAPVIEKAAAATLLLTIDIILADINAASLTFGDITFSNPPASLTTPGVVTLSNATNSTAQNQAATPRAVKAANDNANTRLKKDQNLADLTNKAAARAALELGSAATVNRQVSQMDTIAERLMRVGAFGWGTGEGVSNSYINSQDFNGFTVTGIYFVGGSGNTNTPTGESTTTTIMIVGNPHSDSSRVTQDTVSTVSGGSVKHHRYSNDGGDSWTPWRTVYDSGNQLALGVTPAAARSSLELGTSAKMGTTASRTSTSTDTVLQAKAMNDHRQSDDHDGRYARRGENLADLANKAAARAALELGNAAIKGTTSSRTSSSTDDVLQAKAMNDHRQSDDHDGRYARRGENLADLTNKANARAALELGSAATVNRQASQMDTIAERLMRVGAFGWGTGEGVNNSYTNNQNFNDFIVSGIYFVGGSGNTNTPTGESETTTIMIVGNPHNDSKRVMQDTVSNFGAGSVKHHRYSNNGGASWSPWRTVYDSGNQLALGATPAAARSSLELGTSAKMGTTASRTSTSTDTVLQAKAMNDHRQSDDHDGRYARRGENLADLANKAAARAALELGNAAIKGTTSSRTSSSTDDVLQAKAMNDHRQSDDHDGRYARRGENLADLTNKANARAALELGSAATVNHQASQMDTIAERLMRVGAFGWGTGEGVSNSYTNNQNFNDFIVSGIYFVGGGGNTNTPTGESVTTTIMIVGNPNSDSSRVTQDTVSAVSGGSVKHHRYSNDGGDSWTHWRTVYDSGNLANAYPHSHAVNGWEQTPTGKIDQWGDTGLISPGAWKTVNFPTAYPSVAYSVTLAYQNGSAQPEAGNPFNMEILSRSSFRVYNGGSLVAGYRYKAVGK